MAQPAPAPQPEQPDPYPEPASAAGKLLPLNGRRPQDPKSESTDETAALLSLFLG